jgi:hypothetical protein
MKSLLMLMVATLAVLCAASVAFTPTTSPALAAPGAVLAFGNPPPICPPYCGCPPICARSNSKTQATKPLPKRRKPVTPTVMPAAVSTSEE